MNKINLDEYKLVISLSLVCTIVMLFAPGSVELLRYQSLEVSQGQWWRIFTANLTHSGWNHWLLNFSGLILIDYLYQPTVKQIHRAYLLGFCMLINVLLLHLFMQLRWYVGLSGALHGFIVGGALMSIRQAKYFFSAIVIGVGIKLFAELNWNVNQVTAGFIGANVIEESHLFGSISGFIFGVGYLMTQFLTKKRTHK